MLSAGCCNLSRVSTQNFLVATSECRLYSIQSVRLPAGYKKAREREKRKKEREKEREREREKERENVYLFIHSEN